MACMCYWHCANTYIELQLLTVCYGVLVAWVLTPRPRSVRPDYVSPFLALASGVKKINCPVPSTKQMLLILKEAKAGN